MERTARRRIVRIRQRCFSEDLGQPVHGVWQQDRIAEQTRVGMVRRRQDLFSWTNLNDAAEIHHGNAIGEILYNR